MHFFNFDLKFPAAGSAAGEEGLPAERGIIDTLRAVWYNEPKSEDKGGFPMEHIKTLNTRNLCESAKNGGCGECQTSCQSACKTSCGIANQQCENKAERK